MNDAPILKAHAIIDEQFSTYLAEIRDFLKMPAFSHTGEGISETAKAASRFLERCGFDHASLIDTGGNPVVFGILRGPATKTMLLYSLYDVVPVIEDDWLFPPFEARVVPAARIGLPSAMGEVICARGAANQRVPMLAALFALFSLKTAGFLPASVMVAWEGEEEIGSPNLPVFIEKAGSRLASCSALWMPSMTEDFSGQMRIDRGFKGTAKVEVEITSGTWGGSIDGRDLWSGYLPLVDAPLLRLLRAVGSLLGPDDELRLDGLLEGAASVDPDEEPELDVLLREVDFSSLAKEIGISTYRGGRSGAELFKRFLSEPMMNVVGVLGGYTGPRVFTTLPMSVVAKLDFRLPFNMPTAGVAGLLRAHLERRGFSEAEVRPLANYDGSRTAAMDPIFLAAKAACTALGGTYQVWPTHPAVAPVSIFTEPPLSLPAAFAGLGHGGRAHQANEYATVDGARRLMHYTVEFLARWGAGSEGQTIGPNESLRQMGRSG